MKEAAGEANLTVVAIILIAVVVAVATPLINSLMKSSTWKSCCTDAGGIVDGGKCTKPSGDNGSYSKEACTACVTEAKGDASKCGD